MESYPDIPTPRTRPEAQFTIDETSDGQWEVVLFLGSNFYERQHAPTLERAVLLASWMLRAAEAEYG